MNSNKYMVRIKIIFAEQPQFIVPRSSRHKEYGSQQLSSKFPDMAQILTEAWTQLPSMSYSPSYSSNSPSSSAVASWYCWYSETKSFILLSASVNSISSMPSPVYQCRKALRRNMPVKYSATRLNISWIAVELPRNPTAIFKPFGGMSQTLDLMLFGIHSTKYDEFLFCTLSICSSTSFVDIRPRKRAVAVKYRPWRGSAAHIMFLASNICWVSSGTVSARYCCEPREVSGAKPVMKKCNRGKGMRLTASLRRSAFS